MNGLMKVVFSTLSPPIHFYFIILKDFTVSKHLGKEPFLHKLHHRFAIRNLKHVSDSLTNAHK